MSKKDRTIKRLSCCCCGASHYGRQFHNQDTGFGLCETCVNWIKERGTYTPEEFNRTYGIEGVNYKLA